MAFLSEREGVELLRPSASGDGSRWDVNNLHTEPAQTSCEVTTIDPFVDGDWDRMLAPHESATAFHTAAWARVLTSTYGHTPVYLHFAQAGKTVGLLPVMEVSSPFTGRRGVALPFSDLCPPLLCAGIDPRALVDSVSEIARARRWKYAEFRQAPALRGSAPAAASFYGHKLDLTPGAEALRSRFASNVRRNLAKAERSGITVEISRTREAMLQYHRLHCRTRRRHGAPPQSRRFFLNLHEHMVHPGPGFVALAHRAGRPVAGAVFFQFGRNALYKFGASDERAQEFRASNLVMWEAIRQLCSRGSQELHFGRTSLDNNGLRRFKLAWGAEEEIVEYFQLDTASGSWKTGEREFAARAGAAFRYLPIPVNRFIGRVAYPHLD